MDLHTAEVVASLEGMKVVAEGRICELHEYDFEVNSWHLVERRSRPIARAHAEQWVNCWNSLDRWAALTLLTQPDSD
jgi:hypothetical protein